MAPIAARPPKARAKGSIKASIDGTLALIHNTINRVLRLFLRLLATEKARDPLFLPYHPITNLVVALTNPHKLKKPGMSMVAGF
jgi:hypothetical protein